MQPKRDLNVVWRKEWIHKYEAPWSIFEKILFANQTTRNDIIKAFGVDQVQKLRNMKKVGDVWKELYELKGIDEEILSNTLDFDLHEQNKVTISLLLQPLQHFKEKPSSWFTNHLKWCTDCLQNGFHSWFHQFSLIEICPFHETKLHTRCTSCQEEIPFLLSDRRLGSPFTCNCGYKLADFSNSRWREWDIAECEIKDSSLLRWLSINREEKHPCTKLFFIPQYGRIDLLVNTTPFASANFQRKNKNSRHVTHVLNQEQLKTIFKANKETFKSIDRYIRKKLIKNHIHCINQLRDLRNQDYSKFPDICPHAYAYIFWRKSVLQKTHFYREYMNADDLENPVMNFADIHVTTKIISEEFKYLSSQFLHHNSGTNVTQLIWLQNKFTTHFCLNYFRLWLQIAQIGAQSESVPKWDALNKLKQASLSKFSFKYIIKNDRLSILEAYRIQVNEAIPNMNCPNRALKQKKKINSMQSFIPLKVAMDVFDKPTSENKQFMKYVDRFVSRLNF